jgi:hypothetical protein
MFIDAWKEKLLIDNLSSRSEDSAIGYVFIYYQAAEANKKF